MLKLLIVALLFAGIFALIKFSGPIQTIFAASDNAQFVSQSAPVTLIAGQTQTVSVTFKNIGFTTWTKATGYYLYSQNPEANLTWGLDKVSLSDTDMVKPKKSKAFNFSIKAPLTPGTYNFEWRMSKNSVTFGQSSTNIPILIKVVNVKDFGALGNGIQDDAPKIQAAINSLPTSGGVVYAPSGTYLLGTPQGSAENFPDGSPIQSAVVINRDNTTLQGDINSTIFKLGPSTKMRIITVTSKDSYVKNFIADGNKSQRNGSISYPGGDTVDALLYASSSSNGITFKDCEVKNGVEDGIGFWKSPNGTVDSCNSHDNGTAVAGGAGVVFTGPTNTAGKVINSKALSNTAAGVWVSLGASGTLIQDNDIRNNSKSGIAIGITNLSDPNLVNNITITHNTIRQNGAVGFSGIDINSAQSGLIENNTVIDNYFPGLQISDSAAPSSKWSIFSNTCSNTTVDRFQDFGIRVLGSPTNIELRSNTCADNGISINAQIVVQNPSSVNPDWQSANTISYSNP